MPDNSARRWWALIAIAASVLVVGLDLTVLNLALPTIATDLHASTGDLQWISDAYSLVLAAAMLPAGLLGDRFGGKTPPRDRLTPRFTRPATAALGSARRRQDVRHEDSAVPQEVLRRVPHRRQEKGRIFDEHARVVHRRRRGWEGR